MAESSFGFNNPSRLSEIPWYEDLEEENSPYAMAVEFRSAFRLPFAFTLTEQLEIGLQTLALITEEADEVFEAGQLLADAIEDTQEALDIPKLKEDMLKELCDLKYVIDQYAAVMGWNIDEGYRRVHESNMSKLDEEGYPIYNENGKVMKGPNYKKPNLSDLIADKEF